MLIALALSAVGVALVVVRGRRLRAAVTSVMAVGLLSVMIVTMASPSSAQAALPTDLGTPCPVAVPPAPAAPPAPPVPATPVGASIGNFAWIDSNSNGLQDADEPPAVGTRLTLLDFATNAPVTVGVGGAVIVPTQTTDSTGAYLFADLLPGSYRIALDPAPSTAGEAIGVRLDDSAPGTAINFSQGMRFVIVDFSGAVVVDRAYPAFPGGGCTLSTYYDLPGLGHSIQVFSGAVDVTADPGAAISIVPTPSAGLVVPAAAGDNEIDSDFDSASRQSLAPLTVVEGQQLLTVDLGFEPSNSPGFLQQCV
ncbi:MAG: SdrD B-like domain-containing protein [Rhodoglobus sp.]